MAMKAERKLIMIQNGPGIGEELRERLTRAGWMLEPMPVDGEIPSRHQDYRTVLFDLRHDPDPVLQLAMRLRKSHGFDRMPYLFLGGNNEVIEGLKRDIPLSCFVEPSTLETALDWFLPDVRRG